MTGVSAVESYNNGDVKFLKNFDMQFSVPGAVPHQLAVTLGVGR
jgi:hypothetical protein